MKKTIQQHKDLRQDPQYRQQITKFKKVKQREQEDKEAEKEIKQYEKGTTS